MTNFKDTHSNLQLNCQGQVKVKSVRGRLFTFDIFEEKNNELLVQAHMRTSASEPEPDPEPPEPVHLARSRSRSRNTSPEPEPEPEPTKNVTAPHP